MRRTAARGKERERNGADEETEQLPPSRRERALPEGTGSFFLNRDAAARGMVRPVRRQRR